MEVEVGMGGMEVYNKMVEMVVMEERAVMELRRSSSTYGQKIHQLEVTYE